MPRLDYRIFASVGVVVSVALLQPALPEAAQNRTPPTVTVLPFTGKGSVDEQEAMSDELAARLVETGRFRVLLREWLPVPRVDGTPALESVRQAAIDAGVEYLILAAVTESTAVRRPSPLSIIGPIVARRATRGRPAMRAPVPAPHRETITAVNVRVMDVSSGDVVRSAIARANSSVRPPARPIVGPGLVGSVGAIARLVSRRNSSSSLGAGTERAIADVARTLNLEKLEVRSQKLEVGTQNLEPGSQKKNAEMRSGSREP